MLQRADVRPSPSCLAGAAAAADNYQLPAPNVVALHASWLHSIAMLITDRIEVKLCGRAHFAELRRKLCRSQTLQ